jgi:hypothetical protein
MGFWFFKPQGSLVSGNEDLYQLYRIAKASAAKVSGLTRDFFPFGAATTKEKAVYDWIDFIVMESQPLSVVENAHFISFYKRNVALVKLVEQKIAVEIRWLVMMQSCMMLPGQSGMYTTWDSLPASIL